jgi:glycosyltransferase involved in cell wall biosynthesis
LRIAIATDAWLPQTNGVVRTLGETRRCLEKAGHDILMLTPQDHRTLPLPTYPEIRLSVFPRRSVFNALDRFDPDSLHVATEGPIGLAARRYALRRDMPFTTSYHTQFPRYVRMRVPVPESWCYSMLRWFHRPARHTLVPTRGIRDELAGQGFADLRLWGRGVDTELFRPERARGLAGEAPVLMCMGRVAVEKNIEAFLDLDVPGTKYVVGDGPALAELRRRYPGARFTGALYGEELAAHVAAADVFVFPSRTDTFGLVLLEAMACGVPVAAYPVSGPVDVVKDGVTGCLDEDLALAVTGALALDPAECRAHALKRSWEAATLEFFSSLAFRGVAAREELTDATASRT